MIGAFRNDAQYRQRAGLAVAAACALTGVAMATRPGMAPLVVAGAVLVALSLDWRRGVVALLVVLPFAGLPVFMAGTPGLVARDVLAVAPLYITFAVAMLRSDESILPPLGAALPALVLFAAAVLAGVARAPSLTVGLIGAKVWLAYVPMLAVGYQYVRGSRDLERVLRVTALIGLVPASIALAEWLLATRQTWNGYLWTNDFGPFTRMYGAWFEHVKLSVVAFGPDTNRIFIPRIPSTFTGASQYYGFALVAYASAIAMGLRRRTAPWMLCVLVLGVACIASGVRASYVAAPALLVAAFVLAGTNLRHARYAAAVVAVVAVAAAALDGNSVRIAGMMPAHLHQQIGTAWHEMRSGFTLFGHGTGWDTNAALRYGDTTQRRYIENWYAKASLELGVLGLLSIAVALAAIIVRAVAPLRRVDAGTRQLAAPVAALLLLTVVSLFKGPYVDLDPLNVYFWLLAGMLLGLYRAAAAAPAPGAKAAAL
jgi:hypothetical protein